MRTETLENGMVRLTAESGRLLCLLNGQLHSVVVCRAAKARFFVPENTAEKV